MDDWMQCQTCGLKYRARPAGCPRCAKTAAQQPEPSLVDQIPEAPVYEPPRYEPEARVTEYSSGVAAEEVRPPFRLPWYLLAGSLVLLLVGALISPARTGIGGLLVMAGFLTSAAAAIWTLIVAFGLGAAWGIGALFIPLLGLVALFRAGNLRPLALNFIGVSMFMAGGALMGTVPELKARADAAREAREAAQSSGRQAARGEKEPTREEYIADCKARGRDTFLCGCVAAVFFDELGSETRDRFNRGQETADDRMQLESSVKRNCR